MGLVCWGGLVDDNDDDGHDDQYHFFAVRMANVIMLEMVMCFERKKE